MEKIYLKRTIDRCLRRSVFVVMACEFMILGSGHIFNFISDTEIIHKDYNVPVIFMTITTPYLIVWIINYYANSILKSDYITVFLATMYKEKDDSLK